MGNIEHISQLAEELFSPVGGLRDAEKKLINLQIESELTRTRQRIISELYLSKHLQTAVDKTIASNEKLAESNKKHAYSMRLLTAALVFVGLIQVDWSKLLF